MAFKSANDRPRRDPDSVTVKVWDDEASAMVELGTYALAFDSRW